MRWLSASRSARAVVASSSSSCARARCSLSWLPSLAHSLRRGRRPLCSASSIRPTTLRASPFPPIGVCSSLASRLLSSSSYCSVCFLLSVPLPSGPSLPSKVVKIRTRHAVSCVEPWVFRSRSVSWSSFCLRSLSLPPAPREPPPRILHRPSAPAPNRCRQRPAPRRVESNCGGASCRPRRRLGRHLGLAPARTHQNQQRHLHQRRAPQSDSRLFPERFPGLALDDEDPPGGWSRLSHGR